jgi:hypothetical protein
VRARAFVLALAAAAGAITVATALAGPKDPTKRHTAADTRIAKSIALKRTDLGAGWTETSSGSSGGPDCKAQPDESKLIETADVDPTFDSPNGGAATVDSDVTLYKTPAMALVDWRTAKISILRACLAELLGKELGKKAAIVSARTVHVSLKAPRTLGLHFEFRVKAVDVSVDAIGLLKGRTEVILTAIGVKGSYTRAQLNPLAAVLARRLAKA